MHIFTFLLCTALLFPLSYSNQWDSFTSFLTPRSLAAHPNGNLYAATPGGLLEYSPARDSFQKISIAEGLEYTDLFTLAIDSTGNIWTGGAYPRGYVQVYHPKQGLLRSITHLDISQIDKIIIGDSTAFALYQGKTGSDTGILEFLIDEDNLPVYRDFYTDFIPGGISEFRDLDLYQDSVFVTTNAGIFSAHYKRDILKFSDSWQTVLGGDSLQQFSPSARTAFTHNSYISFNEGNWQASPLEQEGEVLKVEKYEGQFRVLTTTYFYEHFDQDLKIKVPYPDQDTYLTTFTDFTFMNSVLYLGMENYGIFAMHTTTGNQSLLVPPTITHNDYHALTVTQDGYLAATSNEGNVLVRNGQIVNLMPFPEYNYYPKLSEQSSFINRSIPYKTGVQLPISILEMSNGNLVFTNSGLTPHQTWFPYPALVEININNYTLTNTWDTTHQIIDGIWGVYAGASGHMVVNQLAEDKEGNLWLTNAFCEKNSNVLAVQHADGLDWSHVQIPDETSYRPQTVAFDKRNRSWIGFAYEALEEKLYSDGGIKIFAYHDLKFDDSTDSLWLPLLNPEVLPGDDGHASVWSLVFDKMDFLWILSEKGMRGYTWQVTSDGVTLDPVLKANDGTAIDFLAHLSFVKGNRIKVDSANNKWVVSHHGVWVIQESMEPWPSEAGLHPENSGLLSDIVYDIAFDEDAGLVYFATDKGISVLQIPFAENPEKKEVMYVSPNPFIIPGEENLLIKNLAAGSTLKITTIMGNLMAEIRLPSNQSQAYWDGRDLHGNLVGSAVYIIAAHHPEERNMVSKVAVIRK